MGGLYGEDWQGVTRLGVWPKKFIVYWNKKTGCLRFSLMKIAGDPVFIDAPISYLAANKQEAKTKAIGFFPLIDLNGVDVS